MKTSGVAPRINEGVGLPDRFQVGDLEHLEEVLNNRISTESGA